MNIRHSPDANSPGADHLDGLTAWALTPGTIGHEVQCVGLIEALGLEPVIKRVAPGAPWRWLAPWGPAAADVEVAPPWPDLLVASGRQAIPYARMIRRRSHGRSFVVVLQSPGVSPSHFDLVWVPEHDRLRGDNVLVTLTAPHRLTNARLEEAAARYAAAIANLPRPLVCVLLGGTSGAYSFGPAEAERLVEDLRHLAEEQGVGLLVTPSRRTGKDQAALIAARLKDVAALVWEGEGENPYFGYMGLADSFIVTCDSANMLGEAAATGKPVHAYRLPGGNEKFTRFHSALERHGAMRWFDGRIDSWTYPTLDATAQIAASVCSRLAQYRRKAHD